MAVMKRIAIDFHEEYEQRRKSGEVDGGLALRVLKDVYSNWGIRWMEDEAGLAALEGTAEFLETQVKQYPKGIWEAFFNE
jgi:hypothetical protein